MNPASSAHLRNDHSPENLTQGRDGQTETSRTENALVKLYMDVTGETETQARDVFMFVSFKHDESSDRTLK